MCEGNDIGTREGHITFVVKTALVMLRPARSWADRTVMKLGGLDGGRAPAASPFSAQSSTGPPSFIPASLSASQWPLLRDTGSTSKSTLRPPAPCARARRRPRTDHSQQNQCNKNV